LGDAHVSRCGAAKSKPRYDPLVLPRKFVLEERDGQSRHGDDSGSDMNVMPADVHDADGLAGVVLGRDMARIGKARRFLYGQSVE
jgi:hypothetical protein